MQRIPVYHRPEARIGPAEAARPALAATLGRMTIRFASTRGHTIAIPRGDDERDQAPVLMIMLKENGPRA